MGTEYSIAKRDPRETFYIGKANTGYADLSEMPRAPTTPAPKDPEARKTWLKALGASLVHPAAKAMWSIMHEDSYAVFRLSAADRNDLADKLFRGAQAIDTRYQADIVADAIIEWAGDAELTLVNDDGIAAVRHLGFEDSGYRQTGSVYEILSTGEK